MLYSAVALFNWVVVTLKDIHFLLCHMLRHAGIKLSGDSKNNGALPRAVLMRTDPESLSALLTARSTSSRVCSPELMPAARETRM